VRIYTTRMLRESYEETSPAEFSLNGALLRYGYHRTVIGNPMLAIHWSAWLFVISNEMFRSCNIFADERASRRPSTIAELLVLWLSCQFVTNRCVQTMQPGSI